MFWKSPAIPPRRWDRSNLNAFKHFPTNCCGSQMQLNKVSSAEICLCCSKLRANSSPFSPVRRKLSQMSRATHIVMLVAVVEREAPKSPNASGPQSAGVCTCARASRACEGFDGTRGLSPASGMLRDEMTDVGSAPIGCHPVTVQGDRHASKIG